MCISPWSGVRGFERLIWLKYYLLKRQIAFTLGLNDAENTDYMKKKVSNKSCSELNFLQKSQWAHMSISSGSGTRVLQHFYQFLTDKFFLG